MGLFNMLKRSVNNAVKNAVESAVEAKIAPVIESKVDKYIKPFVEDRMETTARTVQETVSQVNLYNYPGDAVDYFFGLLSESFPGYAVEKNVGAGRLGISVPSQHMPKNILLSKAGSPALLILLLPKNSYRLKCITELKQQCESAGIAHMQFFLEFRNEAGYVVNRIQKAL